jgi:hypothetical protein
MEKKEGEEGRQTIDKKKTTAIWSAGWKICVA